MLLLIYLADLSSTSTTTSTSTTATWTSTWATSRWSTGTTAWRWSTTIRWTWTSLRSAIGWSWIGWTAVCRARTSYRGIARTGWIGWTWTVSLSHVRWTLWGAISLATRSCTLNRNTPLIGSVCGTRTGIAVVVEIWLVHNPWLIVGGCIILHRSYSLGLIIGSTGGWRSVCPSYISCSTGSRTGNLGAGIITVLNLVPCYSISSSVIHNGGTFSSHIITSSIYCTALWICILNSWICIDTVW